MILIIALLVLGPSRLPDTARSIGRGMRELRDALQGLGDDGDGDDDDMDGDQRPDPRDDPGGLPAMLPEGMSDGEPYDDDMPEDELEYEHVPSDDDPSEPDGYRAASA